MNSQALSAQLAWAFASLCGLILVPTGRALAQTPYPMRVDASMTTHHFVLGYDGTNWSNAIGYLQEAIDNQLPGGEIWVKEGTYSASAASTSTGFWIAKQLSLYGGFNGTETSVQHRLGSAVLTVLDGAGPPRLPSTSSPSRQ